MNVSVTVPVACMRPAQVPAHWLVLSQRRGASTADVSDLQAVDPLAVEGLLDPLPLRLRWINMGELKRRGVYSGVF